MGSSVATVWQQHVVQRKINMVRVGGVVLQQTNEIATTAQVKEISMTP